MKENSKNTKEGAVRSRRDFYDWLVSNMRIDGIVRVERDPEFDDKDYFRSGGIRLYYTSYTTLLAGVKEGILLEVDFDDTSPNQPVTISSWAYVEKLQTIATKFRREQEGADKNPNFMLLAFTWNAQEPMVELLRRRPQPFVFYWDYAMEQKPIHPRGVCIIQVIWQGWKN